LSDNFYMLPIPQSFSSVVRSPG